jgi:succinyl-CoA synthetase alpha subunit
MSIYINKDTKVITQGITGKTVSSTLKSARNTQTARTPSWRA